MAGGVSKRYESHWTYNPDGDRFEDRIGYILSQGRNLKETLREQALNSTRSARDFEEAQKNSKEDELAHKDPALLAQAPRGGSRELDKRGIVWVNKDGEYLGPATDKSFGTLPPAPNPKDALATESQRYMASLNPNQRSQRLWSRINPVCMESSVKTPTSSYHDSFMQDGVSAEPINKEFHRKKTEFSNYADMKLKYEPDRRR